MDLKQIKDLMAAMEKAGIKKLLFKEKTGCELHLERQDEFPPSHVPSIPHPHASALFIPHPMTRPQDLSHPLHAQPQVHAGIGEAPLPQAQKEEGRYITSPMVGTFYTAPSPDDPVFVKAGDRVEENTVVCIIEAMKVMNEVRAGISGVVAEVYLENSHPVEFGTKLFRIV